MTTIAASVLTEFLTIQQAFHIIASLQLTAYLWPTQAPVKDGDEYDFIVVGAGTAGSVVAARLVEAGYKVMLVEAGGDPPLESVIPNLSGYLTSSKMDWNFTTSVPGQCHKDHTTKVLAAKMISGTNGFSSALYFRGNPHDFQLWAKAANDSIWNYDEVLTYFKKSENLKDPEILKSPSRINHGTNGPLQVIKVNGTTALDGYFDALAETGNKIVQDFNGPHTLGYGNVMYTLSQNDGPRQTTASAYLTPIKENPNLYVLKNTLATKVIFDELLNAVSVEVVTENNKIVQLKARKEIILSSGALNSPKLLMLSGIGPKNHLRSVGVEVVADLPVGKNLQDQPAVLLQYQMKPSDLGPVIPRNPYRTNARDYFVGFAALNKSQSYPDYATCNNIYHPDSVAALAMCSFGQSIQDDICQQFYDAAKDKTTLSTILNLMQPKSRGVVSLKSKNPYENVLVNLNFFSEKSDVEKMVDSIKDFTRLSHTKYFKSLNASLLLLDLPGCKNFKLGSRDYWRCYVQCMSSPSNHYAGTCAMGSVVDSRLRVYNVNRLRVADASVQPVLTCGNGMPGIVMIAEKAAAMIIEDHKLKIK